MLLQHASGPVVTTTCWLVTPHVPPLPRAPSTAPTEAPSTRPTLQPTQAPTQSPTATPTAFTASIDVVSPYNKRASSHLPVVNPSDPLTLQAVVISGVQPSDFDPIVWSSPNTTLDTFISTYPGAGEQCVHHFQEEHLKMEPYVERTGHRSG
jgi:hypothetical protein